jgi:CDP-diacylglycerol---glycerol-3-phosphate 3-phosphatidyltransferase
MISVYNIKPKFQQLLRPILVGLYKMGVTANAITVASILLSLGLGVVFWFNFDENWVFLLISFGLLLRMALNALDGMMARTYNMQSKLGEILNEIGDVISDIFIFFPLIQLPFVHQNLLFIFILLSVINEFSGVLSKAISGERRYDGPMGKSDRALFIGLICLLVYFWKDAYLYVNYALGLMIFLLLISTYTRLKKTIN